MARFEPVTVRPDMAGVDRDARLGGRYLRYHPDLLLDTEQWVDPETMEYLGDVSAKVATVAATARAAGLTYLYGLLMRSESIASSRIEGHVASAQQVAVAQVSGEGTADVLAVSDNIAGMRAATTALSQQPVLDDSSIHLVHAALLPGLHGSQPGYRTVQNWISGTSLLRAKFVPPPYEFVQHYMDDLLRYCNEGAETSLLKAAVVHAQFETIHPYIDGNGRTGRALTHTVLIRSGLISGPIVPFSAALATNRDRYIAGLTAYRYDGHERRAGLSTWVREFADAMLVGAKATEILTARSRQVIDEWRHLTADARSDSVLHRLPGLLMEQPVVTVGMVAVALAVSEVAASSGLQRAEQLGIVRTARAKLSRSTVYVAHRVLDLVTLVERGLASADWDTVVSAPSRPAPPLPESMARRPKMPCEHVLSRSGLPCRLPAGHRGQHRPARP